MSSLRTCLTLSTEPCLSYHGWDSAFRYLLLLMNPLVLVNLPSAIEPQTQDLNLANKKVHQLLFYRSFQLKLGVRITYRPLCLELGYGEGHLHFKSSIRKRFVHIGDYFLALA